MKTDQEFISALNDSEKSVSKVASWLSKGGADVMIKPTVIRPNVESRKEYLDNGDIEIRQRIEIKHRNLNFTNVSDYPFDTVIVDEVHKFDRIIKAQLWGYVILNKMQTHCCVIKLTTHSEWKKKSRYDKKDKQSCEYYFCPREHCVFYKI